MAAKMRVAFAPDWVAGNDYQALLAGALARCGVEVVYPPRRRGLPLWRGVRGLGANILHVHWPEAYFPELGDRWEFFRQRRFGLDLFLAARGLPLVYTAHNTVPHNRGRQRLAVKHVRKVLVRSTAVFVHSAAATDQLRSRFGKLDTDFVRIPHGDLAVTMPRHEKATSRRALGLGHEPLCLMFGAVEPYKGIEGVIDWWRAHSPTVSLAVVGRPITPEYQADIERRAAGVQGVRLHLVWEPKERLGLWLSAADCTVFNYRDILTSGAASLARSLGLPILLPRGLTTLELGEPCERVLRFTSLEWDFKAQLERAAALGADFASAAHWRDETSWDRVAETTAETYRAVLAGGRPRR